MKLLTGLPEPKGLLTGYVVEFKWEPIWGVSPFEEIMLEQDKTEMIRRIAEVFAVPSDMLGL